MYYLFNWENISAFLNSNFTASLSGALAGAFAGAMAAQRIAERAKQRETILKEIRSTNAAIMAAFNICNSGLALKNQFTKEIYDTYIATKKALKEFKQKKDAGQQSADLPFEFQADFRTLNAPVVPIDMLRSLMYEEISASGRPLALVSTLDGVIASLADVIQKRNILIDRFRNLDKDGQKQLPAFYFGIPYDGGHISTEYSDAIESLHNLNDDVIFFSELLVCDLTAHGKHIRDKYKKIAKVKEEKIHAVDFTELHEIGLMPDAANYTDWLKGFPNTDLQDSTADAKKRRV